MRLLLSVCVYTGVVLSHSQGLELPILCCVRQLLASANSDKHIMLQHTQQLHAKHNHGGKSIFFKYFRLSAKVYIMVDEELLKTRLVYFFLL